VKSTEIFAKGDYSKEIFEKIDEALGGAE